MRVLVQCSTEIKVSKVNSLFENDKKYIASTYNRFPIEIIEGKGSICKDSDGKEYIDLGTGIAVNTFGFCDEIWIEAVTKQLNTFQHTSNLYYTDPCVRLAELLSSRTGCSKVFFSNSGAEANECAIKVARRYATDVKGIKEPVILTLVNSFHGRTITTLAATGQEVFHKDFLPLTKGFEYTPANDINALIENVEKYSPSAIMFETVQGEGGVNPLTKEFVNEMVKIAKEKDILLIVDEVQTGNGRTGNLYPWSIWCGSIGPRISAVQTVCWLPFMKMMTPPPSDMILIIWMNTSLRSCLILPEFPRSLWKCP